MIFTIRNTNSREFIRMLDHMIGKTNKSISFFRTCVQCVYNEKKQSATFDQKIFLGNTGL